MPEVKKPKHKTETIQSHIQLKTKKKALHLHAPCNRTASLTLSCSLRRIILLVDFPSGSDGKVSVYNAGDPCLIPGLGRSPGEMAAHSSTLAWKIPWTEEPGRLPSMGLQRVGHNWATSLHFTSSYLSIHLPVILQKWLDFSCCLWGNSNCLNMN